MIPENDLRDDFLVGWKEIIPGCGLKRNKQTLKRWTQLFECPILRLPDGSPITRRDWIARWVIEGEGRFKARAIDQEGGDPPNDRKQRPPDETSD